MASMGEAVAKLLYLAVVEDDEAANETTSFRYTRSVLQSTLQFMGCKARHAFKISQGVFEKMKCEFMVEKVDPDISEVSQNEAKFHARMDEAGVERLTIDDDKSRKPFELYKRRTTVFVGRKHFLDVVCESLSAYKYVGPNQRADLVLACRIRERKESLTVLLCGTSGCGKSTLSALLGGRLGITTVISTDSIRHMMRSFVDEEHNPLLWASTYQAGEHLDPVAVAEAKAKRKAKKTSGVSAAAQPKDQGASSTSLAEKKSEGDKSSNNMISTKQMAIEGFKAQSEMIIDSLDRLITSWEERKESAVVEGVHLSLNFVMGLMKKHPSIIPFMVYISNEEKHLERFAVRAKYMTLDPARNKYVKYIRNIRRIQEYLCNRADKHLVPKINNTNVDRSVAAIHATVFSCLRRRASGENLYDPVTNTVPLVNEEYRNQCAANSVSSKGMFQLIQRQGSSRRLMALLNYDGSVAKAWPVDVVDDKGRPVVGRSIENGLGNPLYGPLVIGRAESVNLRFGHFGISAWQSDAGGTSHASSVDESRGEVTDNGSRYYSSCCSTPRFSDGASKEHMEEESVHGSDEEDIDEPVEVDSDEDVSDGQKSHGEEELEGSVDEGSKSDEEYDDLAMLDDDDNQGSGYLSDNEDEFKAQVNSQPHFSSTNDEPRVIDKNKLRGNLHLLPKRKSEPFSEMLIRSPKDKNERKLLPSPSNRRLKKRSQSIPASKGHESLIKILTSNEAPLC